MLITKIAVWIEFFKQKHRLDVSEKDYKKYEHIIESVSLIDEMNPNQFTLIYDYNNEKSLYVSKNSFVFNKGKKWVLTNETFLKHIHSKDIPYLYEIFHKMLKDFLPKHKNDFERYVLRYNCRLRSKVDGFIFVDIRHRTIASDKHGTPWLSLVIIDTSPQRILRPAELIHIDTNEKLQVLDSNQITKQYSFTKRENEILKLYTKEQSNESIASELHISIDTVHFHMKNIRKKTGTKSIKDAAIIANYYGL